MALLLVSGAACASAPPASATGAPSVAPDATSALPPSATPTATEAPTSSAATTTPPPVTPPVTTATPTPTASAATPTFKAAASFDEPKFEGGEVPNAKETLEKFSKAVVKCVDEGGGVGAKGATIKIQFLVRAKGIAEGIDVLDASGLGEKPGKCVRDVFKKKPIGTPSADPVGVTFTITFSARQEK